MDLHTHSEYSDGAFLRPEDLIAACALKGINLAALTDHDSSRGYEEARKTGERFGMTILPGAEITTPDYHLLALNFDPTDRAFEEFLVHSRELQERTCEKRIELLQGVGIPITLEKVKRVFPKSRLGKVNIIVTMAQDSGCRAYMQEKHPEMTPRQVQWHYMGDNGVASGIDKYGVTPKEAIDAVHNAGGLIGIAHPAKDIKIVSELDELKRNGIDFVEVQPRLRQPYLEKAIRMVDEWTAANDMPITYGSDFHGNVITDRELLARGENVLTPRIQELLNRGYIKI